MGIAKQGASIFRITVRKVYHMIKIHTLKLFKVDDDRDTLEDRKLSSNEKLLLYLLKELKADSGSGLSLSLTELGDKVGMSRNTTAKAVTALHDAGYIVHTKGKGHVQGSIKLTL